MSPQERSWVQAPTYYDSILKVLGKIKVYILRSFFLLQAEGILQETRSVVQVLDQIQKEKTSEMDIYLRTFK